jgi:uncharacterized protein
MEAAPNNWKYRLILSAVPKDGTPYCEEISLQADKPISYWAQVYTFKSPLNVDIEACRIEGRLLTVISVEANASVPCSRCLEPADIKIAGKLRYFFSLRPHENKTETAETSEYGEEELIILDSWEDEIDLSPMIWEVLITSLPASALCSEDCRGLCPQCGVNLNKSSCNCKKDETDPRFDALRQFIKDQ